MSDYVGSGLTLALVVAAIVGMLFLGGRAGPGEGSIIPEAMAASPAEADYGWKAPFSPTADARGEVAEYF